MSLYEKYRSGFPALVGCLENARAGGRFAHAFLIVSSDETVRREFPVVLAQIAGCPDAVNGRPNVNCPYCDRLERGVYSEYYTLSPVGKMYQIKVGDRVNPEPNTLRSLIGKLNYTSITAARRKLGVILEADRMNDEAQNALLKTLEEPPPDTTLILATGSPGSLLPTTRSRCQTVPLPSNACRLEFAGAPELFRVLDRLCFESDGDLIAAAEGAAELIRIASELNAAARAKVEKLFQSDLDAAARAEDPAYLKRVQARLDDAAAGEYMRERRAFLAAIEVFCSQVFLLAEGADPADLPNPEVFPGEPRRPSVERAAAILREAEDLRYTMLFNVGEELALRTFAVNLALPPR